MPLRATAAMAGRLRANAVAAAAAPRRLSSTHDPWGCYMYDDQPPGTSSQGRKALNWDERTQVEERTRVVRTADNGVAAAAAAVAPQNSNGTAPTSDGSKRPVIAVLGLGTIGHSVAQVFAQAGYSVQCFSPSAGTRAKLHTRVLSNLDMMASAGMIPASASGPLSHDHHCASILERLRIVDTEDEAVVGAQYVWESVPEVLDTKKSLLERVERHASDETIIVSTTSTFPMSEMAAGMRLPGRAIVCHPFNPPHLIPVIEVVPGQLTTQATVDASTELIRSIGKQPVRIQKETPGFVVNRMQLALLREAWSLLDEGVASAQDIDTAVTGTLGLRMASTGPLRVADFAGLDIWQNIFHSLQSEDGEGGTITAPTPPALDRLVRNGHLGAKTKRGFYDDYTGPGELQRRVFERDQAYAATVKLFHPDCVVSP
jgi:3-hydroxybutyryl-CoA dehydrogenase